MLRVLLAGAMLACLPLVLLAPAPTVAAA